MENKNILFGIAWYRENQWELFKKVADDTDKLEETCQEWQKSAKKIELDLLLKGTNTERVDIDINELIKWCKRNKKSNTSESRSEYVAEFIKNKNV